MNHIESGQRLPRKIVKLLREVREAATLQSTSFDWPDSKMTATCRSGNFKGRPDDFIKQRVKIHHDTWIIGPIDRILAWAEDKTKQN